MPISSDTRPTGDTALWLIGGFKLIKGLLLVAVATGALHVLHKDVADVAAAWVAHVHVDPDNRYVARVLSTVSLLDERKLKAISAGTFLYSALLLTEGTGLLLRQRWAIRATQRCSVSSACWLSRFSSSACARSGVRGLEG